MQKNKVEIIKKDLSSKCWCCEGLRVIYNKKTDILELCSTCDGTGIFKEYIYYHIANGICFSGDTLK